jgi:hypothetical protein
MSSSDDSSSDYDSSDDDATPHTAFVQPRSFFKMRTMQLTTQPECRTFCSCLDEQNIWKTSHSTRAADSLHGYDPWLNGVMSGYKLIRLREEKKGGRGEQHTIDLLAANTPTMLLKRLLASIAKGNCIQATFDGKLKCQRFAGEKYNPDMPLEERNKALFHHDMGYGKSGCAMAVLESIYPFLPAHAQSEMTGLRGHAKVILVAAPKCAILAWETVLKQFGSTYFQTRCFFLHTYSDEHKLIGEINAAISDAVYIYVTFEKMSRWSTSKKTTHDGLAKYPFSQIHYTAVVVDEYDKILRKTTANKLTVLEHITARNPAAFKIGMSGTPHSVLESESRTVVMNWLLGIREDAVPLTPSELNAWWEKISMKDTRDRGTRKERTHFKYKSKNFHSPELKAEYSATIADLREATSVVKRNKALQKLLAISSSNQNTTNLLKRELKKGIRAQKKIACLVHADQVDDLQKVASENRRGMAASSTEEKIKAFQRGESTSIIVLDSKKNSRGVDLAAATYRLFVPTADFAQTIGRVDRLSPYRGGSSYHSEFFVSYTSHTIEEVIVQMIKEWRTTADDNPVGVVNFKDGRFATRVLDMWQE